MNTLRSLMAGVLLLVAPITAPATALAALDTTAPATVASLTGTKGSDGWYSTPVTVTLAATDAAGGSGVAKIEYSLDNASWQSYTAPLVFDKDTNGYVFFRSTDLAGNVETPAKSQEIKVNRSGLVGLWHMDGDWRDASVAGNHGTGFNGVTFSTKAKIGAQSGSFDGTNDYVAIRDADTLSPQANGRISISAWVYLRSYPSAGQGRTPVIAKGDGSYEYALYVYSNGNAGLSLWQLSGGSHIEILGGAIPLNTWTHVAGVYDISAQKKAVVYVNGAEAASGTTTSGSVANGPSPVHIAHRPDNAAYQYLNALLDEVSIYNRALSEAEVQEHYRHYAVNAPTVNPVASPIANSTITLGGTKPADTAVAVNGNILVPLDGTTNWQGSYTLTQGTNTISVTAVDGLNRNSLPVVSTVVLDMMPPQVTATAPARNAVVSAAPGAVALTLADAASAVDYAATLRGAAVTNAYGLQVAGAWSTSGSGAAGSVVFTPSAELGDGSYTVTIKPTDVLGNGTTYSLSFAVDRTPPAAPVIDPVAGAIRVSARTITGTKSADSASITVLCAGAFAGTVSYPTATTWSVNVWGLKEGANYVTAYAYDAAGNASTSATATITLDTVTPSVGATPTGGLYSSTQSVVLAASEPGIIYYTIDGSTPTAGAATYGEPISIPAGATLRYFARDLAGNDSEIKTENYVIDSAPPVLAISALSDGALTNNEILNISGTVTDSTGVKELMVNEAAVQVNADGSFSYPLVLKAGPNCVTVAATDLIGNKATSTRSVTLDQMAPVLVVYRPADNSKTGTGLLELHGTVDKASTVTVKRKDAVQSALMSGADFIATVSLDPGYDTIEIIATDLAGNQSSQKRTVVFDDQVPSLAVTVPNQDVRTNQSSVTIKGTVYDALTTVGVTVSVDGNVVTVPVIDGAFEQVVSFSEEKTYSIMVTATNEAGTSTTVQRNVIYDITPPSLGIDPVATPVNQTNGTISGTREADAVVTVACATATVGEVSYPTATTWQVAVSGLAEGQNLITAASTDAAGNAVTATTTIVLVTKSPEITLQVTPDVIWPPKRKMVPVKITGGVEAYGSRIASTSVSVSDEYGKIQYKNLALGSTVMLDAWCNGTDKDGRKYTITVATTTVGGMTTTRTATVTVLHDKSGKTTSSAAVTPVKAKTTPTTPAAQAKTKATSTVPATPAKTKAATTAPATPAKTKTATTAPAAPAKTKTATTAPAAPAKTKTATTAPAAQTKVRTASGASATRP
ncbi:OmpL47-type beta-barrel domain-containing protein [Geomonas subterranea]|uniref:OmpL47-type beta-barrel domain-containing protein n=1 Tax=Geomonas subterranea TaxID=2847989 RepID=UPI001CD7FECD|nr:LamG-like jellyroll fold domain-containing protein [Geomonas fuzhouensis]